MSFPGRKAHDTEIRLRVSLEDLHNGNTVLVNVSRNEICGHCHGGGVDPHSHARKCSACGGRGHKTFVQHFGGGMKQHVRQQCRQCGGSGAIQAKCPVCHGNRLQDKTAELKVKISKGMRSGEKVVVHNQGNQHPHAAPGHVVFILEERRHSLYRREGDDLRATLKIPLHEALTGFERALPGLDGQTIRVQHTGVCQPGQILRVGGEGMPRRGTWGGNGDLLVEVQVEFPTRLSTKQKQQLRKLLPEQKRL